MALRVCALGCGCLVFFGGFIFLSLHVGVGYLRRCLRFTGLYLHGFGFGVSCFLICGFDLCCIVYLWLCAVCYCLLLWYGMCS